MDDREHWGRGRGIRKKNGKLRVHRTEHAANFTSSNFMVVMAVSKVEFIYPRSIYGMGLRRDLIRFGLSSGLCRDGDVWHRFIWLMVTSGADGNGPLGAKN
uniref:Uncharacterized protein n=1 Tax=Strigamia maritima TaxID=126957 RepID=T1J3T6_STRMM